MRRRVLLTIVFTDIVGSTGQVARIGDGAWADILERHEAAVRELVAESRGLVVKGTGDGLLATFDSPSAAVRFALAAVSRADGPQIRAGLHTGEVELREDGDLEGVAVHLAARVAALATAGEVLASAAVYEVTAGSELRFIDRGRHVLRGYPERMRLYAIVR